MKPLTSRQLIDGIHDKLKRQRKPAAAVVSIDFTPDEVLYLIGVLDGVPDEVLYLIGVLDGADSPDPRYPGAAILRKLYASKLKGGPR